MNAEFFALAFTAALNPKLLALDLLLIENRRPRAMFLCVLLGGMTVALTIGLLDVLTLHADAIKSQGKANAGADLALGLLLLLVAGGVVEAQRLEPGIGLLAFTGLLPELGGCKGSSLTAWRSIAGLR